MKKPSPVALFSSGTVVADIPLAVSSKSSPDAMNAASGSKDATSRSLTQRDWVEAVEAVESDRIEPDLGTRMIRRDWIPELATDRERGIVESVEAELAYPVLSEQSARARSRDCCQ